MSNEERPAAATEALATAFEGYTKRELAEMMAHVVKTYVMDGTTPNRIAGGIIDFPKHLRDLNFTQLVAHLKMHLDLPELNLLSVVGSDVMVKLAGRDYSLTDPHSQTAPPAAPAEQPASPSAAAAGASAAATQSAPEAPAEPEGGVELSDRFRMLELD